MNEPSPETTFAILLGSQEWPECPGLAGSAAFAASATRMQEYLSSSSGMAIHSDNILNLFDNRGTPSHIIKEIDNFLKRRTQKLELAGRPAQDLVFYFVGHGGFMPATAEYFLFVHFTDEQLLQGTALGIEQLAEVFKKRAKYLRCYLILDACFSAAAVPFFQSSQTERPGAQIKSDYAKRGVSLLCSSGNGDTSKAPLNSTHTMFTGALLTALAQGDPTGREKLTLQDVQELTFSIIQNEHGSAGVRPELHSPGQGDGRIDVIPLFPNAAASVHVGTLLDAFAAVVRNYRIAETGFSLASDLNGLNLARVGGAYEAVVLLCNRVVEAMARAAIREPGRLPSEKLADLLRELVDYQGMPVALKQWLDLLRYLGNDVRHATRPVTENDADVAFAVLLRWLYWTFCEASHGPKLTRLTTPNQPTDVLLPRELARLMDDAEATGEAVLAQLTDAYPTTSPALLTPMVPAAAAESLLARDQLHAAGQVLDIALRRFPRDLRLRQLRVLYWSRRGKAERNVEFLHRAVKELTSLLPHGGGSAADEETFGILAGVYKRLADLDSENSANWLELSCKTYRTGWEKSGFTNYYLGINAAAMTILLGHPSELVERVAVRIRDGIAALEQRLRAVGRGERPLGYWDQITWAEAELLMGEWDRAGALYQDAFARFESRKADIAVSVEQAVLILDRLGQPELAIKVLGRWAPTH